MAVKSQTPEAIWPSLPRHAVTASVRRCLVLLRPGHPTALWDTHGLDTWHPSSSTSGNVCRAAGMWGEGSTAVPTPPTEKQLAALASQAVGGHRDHSGKHPRASGAGRVFSETPARSPKQRHRAHTAGSRNLPVISRPCVRARTEHPQPAPYPGAHAGWQRPFVPAPVHVALVAHGPRRLHLLSHRQGLFAACPGTLHCGLGDTVRSREVAVQT